MNKDLYNKDMENRSAICVMLGLIGMIKPLLGMMCIAICMGCIGNLMAIFIPILGGVGIGIVLGYISFLELKIVFIALFVCAVLRGILRYIEQASNHYIAFKLLARIRHQIFASLRKLTPAKLDSKEKGNLISIITSDIELLEVFYAHTISPIVIAVLTSFFMSLFIGYFDFRLGILAAIFYIIVGFIIPILNSKTGQKYGQQYRNIYGKMNTTILDNLYGLDEILQYQKQKERQQKMNDFTENMEQVNAVLKFQESIQRINTDTIILIAGIFMTIYSGGLALKGIIHAGDAIICIIAIMSSFGPTAALAALSNNLNQTLASGNRVLNLLEEKPVVMDIHSGIHVPDGKISIEHVNFSYPGKEIENQGIVLKDFSLQIKENTIHGILGRSGCGKSTLLKLLMRFYETDQGSIYYGTQNINEIDTAELRKQISYVTQETFLFEDTIENNIKIAKENATREEVIEAARKASIHEFISSLPQGYDTKLGELGATISGGERQRIGIARAFLHNARIIFLDEPTSNIDSLNEGILLKSLLKEKKNKMIVLVSHRKSTMSIANEIIQMQ